MKDQICIEKNHFSLYVFLLFCLIVFFLYIITKKYEHMSNVDLDSQLANDELKNKINKLQDLLFNCKLTVQDYERKIIELTKERESTSMLPFLNKIYNPLYPPENIYRDKYDSYNKYQQIGYITNLKDGQFPVFARDKYLNKSDKQEYYTINEGRNSIKIPFKTKNDNEMFDGDSIIIPELSSISFVFKKYNNAGLRYNPN